MYLLGRDLSGYEETKEWYEAAAEKKVIQMPSITWVLYTLGWRRS